MQNHRIHHFAKRGGPPRQEVTPSLPFRPCFSLSPQRRLPPQQHIDAWRKEFEATSSSYQASVRLQVKTSHTGAGLKVRCLAGVADSPPLLGPSLKRDSRPPSSCTLLPSPPASLARLPSRRLSPRSLADATPPDGSTPRSCQPPVPAHSCSPLPSVLAAASALKICVV